MAVYTKKQLCFWHFIHFEGGKKSLSLIKKVDKNQKAAEIGGF